MSLRTRLLGLIAGSCVVAALVAPADADALRRGFFGIFTYERPSAQAEFALIRDSGIGVYRMALNWSQIEPTRPNRLPVVGNGHSYDWSQPDEIMRRALQNGLKVQPTFYSTPSWLTDDREEAPMATQEARAYWRDFVKAAVKRYGSGGDFFAENPDLPRRPIRDWQCWNEQNSSVRYLPEVDPHEYARLVQITRDAVKQVDGRSRVVLGGMFGTPRTSGSMTSWRFLNRLYEVDGFKRSYDIIALHPYSPDMYGVKFQVRKIRQVLRRHGDGRRKLYVTEIGWSSAAKGTRRSHLFAGRRGQAKLLKRSYKLMIRKRKAWNVRRVFWISWRDPDPPTPQNCEFCKKSGLLERDLTPKPSYRKFLRITGAR